MAYSYVNASSVRFAPGGQTVAFAFPYGSAAMKRSAGGARLTIIESGGTTLINLKKD